MTYTCINSVIPRGKALLIALVAFAMAAPALAQTGGDTRGICIQADEIDHTHVLNDRQILFYMKNRKVWLNTLQARCITLPIQETFAMESGFSDFCANAQSIRVANTSETCHLGEFTPYQKPVGHS